MSNFATLMYAICGVTGLIGLALAIWGFVGDRARGRQRCPKCWYDMAGVDLDADDGSCTCPECGRTIKRTKDLARPRRRRWAIVVGTILGGLSVGGGAVPNVEWQKKIPSTVLIWWLPYAEDSDSLAWQELFSRFDPDVQIKLRTDRVRPGNVRAWEVRPSG